jgi:hypothetical protein
MCGLKRKREMIESTRQAKIAAAKESFLKKVKV